MKNLTTNAVRQLTRPTFVISVNFRETEFFVTESGQTHWRFKLGIGGCDWVIQVLYYLWHEKALLVARPTAERVLAVAGSALPLDQEHIVNVKGRNYTTGLPSSIEVSSVEIRDAISIGVQGIIQQARRCLNLDEFTYCSVDPTSLGIVPSNMKAAISNQPIVLTGEFGSLPKFDQLLSQELRMRIVVHPAPDAV